MLDSNIDVLTALKSYYVSLATNEKFPLRQECQKSIFVFAADVDKIFSWQRAQIPRTKLLEGNIAYRKVFVSSWTGQSCVNVWKADVARLCKLYKTKQQLYKTKQQSGLRS